MRAINPATGELVGEYAEMTPSQVETIIAETAEAFREWRRSPLAHRSELMRRAAEQLRKGADACASLMAEEMGKPVRQGRAEMEKCAWVCEYYAENGEDFLQRREVVTDARLSYVTFEPLGVVLSVMPWNFPFWQVFRFAAPALMAGNAAVLKHASNVPGSALAIQETFEKAGFPENLFRTLLIGGSRVDAVIENALIAAVTLTGSSEAGKAVASKAGQMLKKTVLELGGSDPYVVLEDAELEEAVRICVASRLINAGQSCIAAKRFIVVEPILDRFEERFVEEMRRQRMGDPRDDDTDIGPLARRDLRDELHEQVRKSIDRGAKCLLGGEIPEGEGAYYPPTVLTDVKPGMPAYDEELFGPVAAIAPVENEKQAIEVANDSVFGLGAAVFTRDEAKGERIAAEELQAGCCFVNAPVKSDPRLPFGGVKQSGYGRELSQYGMEEFVNIKTVYVG